MARKPDVFEQMASQVWCKPTTSSIEMDVRLAEEFTNTLRRYHARVRRMVAIYAKTYPVAEEMLRNLDRMKKGK